MDQPTDDTQAPNGGTPMPQDDHSGHDHGDNGHDDSGMPSDQGGSSMPTGDMGGDKPVEGTPGTDDMNHG